MTVKGWFKSNLPHGIFILFLLALSKLLMTLANYLGTPMYNYLQQFKFQAFLLFLCINIAFDLCSRGLSTIGEIHFMRQTQNDLHRVRDRMTRHYYQTDFDQTTKMQNDLNKNLQILTTNYAKSWEEIYLSVLGALFSIGALLTFNWSLIVMTVIIIGITILIPKIFQNAISHATLKVSQQNQHLLDTIEKWVSGLDELRRYLAFAIFSEKIHRANKNLKTATMHNQAILAASDFTNSVVGLIGQIALSLFAAILYFKGKISFGAVIVSSSYSYTIMNSVMMMSQSMNKLNSSKKVNEQILELQRENTNSTSASEDEIADVEVKNLAVSFPNGETITYPDFLIKKGEKVLLSGDSGTGKSTLFKTILGEITPSKGQIIYKNKLGKSIQPNLAKIGYIAQDATLFPDTILNNITMFNSNLNDHAEDFAKKMGLANDLEDFPDGIATKIDLDKDNLSGGQKQKVVLARAEAHDSNLILLDEATSAIDSHATKEILQNLLKSDKTIIMIAHNFSSDLIDMFDKEVKLGGKQ